MENKPIHYYLRYVENKELRKIKTYIKSNETEELLSLKEKILILKLHELFDNYDKRKIGLEKFLGIVKVDGEDYFEKSLKLFEPYFVSKNQQESLKKAIKKIKKLKERENYNFLGSFRRDKIEERLRKILWHVIPTKKNFRYMLIGEKNDSESFFYFSGINDLKTYLKFLGVSEENIGKSQPLDGELMDEELILLTKKLSSKKIDMLKLDSEHEQLQKELAEYYFIAEFYYLG